LVNKPESGLFLGDSIIIIGLICTIYSMIFKGIIGSCFKASFIGKFPLSSVMLMASGPKMSSKNYIPVIIILTCNMERGLPIVISEFEATLVCINEMCDK